MSLSSDKVISSWSFSVGITSSDFLSVSGRPDFAKDSLLGVVDECHSL